MENTGIKEFVSQLPSKDKDQLVTMLQDMVYGVYHTSLSSIEDRLAKTKEEIDEINDKREQLSQEFASMETVYKKLEKFLDKNQDATLQMFFEILRETLQRLKQKIIELKPEEALERKYTLKMLKKEFVNKQKIGSLLLEELNGI